MRAGAKSRGTAQTAQAWVELKADDPAAVSALLVDRTRLAAGGEVSGLRRLRLFELRGRLPARSRLEALLHASTQFYNPHKERCVVRTAAREPAPVPVGTPVVIVTERGGERCVAAERWWLHETGDDIEVREGVAWVVELKAGVDAAAVEDLVTVRDRRRGLLCNPRSQQARIATSKVPLPWIGPPAGA